MVTTIPYIVHYNILHSDKSIYLPNAERDTKAWTIFLKMHIMSSFSFRTISIWLTVYLACFRYFYLRTSLNINSKNIINRVLNWIQENFLKLSKIIMGVVIIYMSGIIFNMPLCFYSTVKEEEERDFVNATKIGVYYYLEQNEINLKINNLTLNVILYSQILLTKLIPCFFIFIFTSLLIHKLIAKKRNENKLRKGLSNTKLFMEQSSMVRGKRFSSLRVKKSTITTAIDETKSNQNDDLKIITEILSANNLSKYPSKKSKSSKDNSRTTFMLVVVCFLFLFVEFPITILTIMSIAMDEIFFNDFYIPLVEFMDISILMYTSINLVLYSTMSSAFRKTLCKLFKRFVCK
jgi:hypothetical protein